MTAVSLQTLHALGWTLLHFVWQGAALAALLAAAQMMSRNANVRYALGLGTLVLMMAAPLITFTWLNRTPDPIPAVEISATLPAPDAIDTPAAVAATDPLVHAPAAVSSMDSLVRALAARTNREDMMLWVVQAWFVGVMLLSVRTAGGLFWLARTRRGEIEPLSEEIYRQCLLLQQRMGLKRHIRYGQSRGLDSPVVMGWLQPVVLVTTQAITGLSPQQLQAIIAHELAHVRRYDALVNLFQIAAEMFLFYHPAVWWVSRRIRIEREVCCDHEALAACGEPVSYARALTMMEEWRAAPSMLMAANRSPLAERVLRLLGVQGTSARSRAAGLGACVMGIAAALFAGSVFVAAAQATAADTETKVVTPAPAANPVPTLALAPAAEEAPAAAPEPARVPGPPASATPKAPGPPISATPKAPGPPISMRPKAPAPPVEAKSPRADARSNQTSFVNDVEGAGLHNVSIDELIAMKVQGITPEYIKGMLATRLGPDADELIAMKVNGVTPEYIDEVRKLVIDVKIDDVIAMKVNGITPEYIRDMQAAGMDIRDADEVIAARVQGITPELIQNAIGHGFKDLTIGKLTMLRNFDII